MAREIDQQSRWHLRTFGGQVMFLAVIGLPALLVDGAEPALYLTQLRTMFGLSAFLLLALATISRRPLPRSHLCIWDHAMGFQLLKLGCALALRALG
jgi:hypothetical protein